MKRGVKVVLLLVLGGAVLLGLDLRAADLDDALLIEELDARASFLGCRMSASLSRKLAS